ncbi:MAG: hypothetical protein M3M84_02140 [Thermoproteota archaeon]|nr:hypothetical protein [Thermoproteota archaeon]
MKLSYYKSLRRKEDTSFDKKMEYEPNISKIFFMSWNMNFVKPNRTLMIAVIIP